MHRVAEHGLEWGSLRFGDGLHAVEEMERQLVHRRVPEGHLRFDADDADYTEVGCDVDRVVDQRRFADARGAGEQDGGGDPTLGVTQELIDDDPFDGAADEHLARLRSRRVARVGPPARGPGSPRSCARVGDGPAVAR